MKATLVVTMVDNALLCCEKTWITAAFLMPRKAKMLKELLYSRSRPYYRSKVRMSKTLSSLNYQGQIDPEKLIYT
jgi:hypothetical protein